MSFMCTSSSPPLMFSSVSMTFSAVALSVLPSLSARQKGYASMNVCVQVRRVCVCVCGREADRAELTPKGYDFLT